MTNRIIPLNLPAKARLEKPIAGNPATSRLESAVANCHPGLEVDQRNLDRRFFPGLVFEFLYDDPGQLRGAQLMEVDLNDPELPDDDRFKTHLKKLAELVPANSASGVTLFLHSLAQGPGRIALAASDGSQMLDGRTVWRLIRSLEPGYVVIELAQYEGSTATILHFDPPLRAPRRTFQKPSGELSPAYRPGELTQSLCSPWQHDFRDCSCNYWAANHPDIALPAHPADIPERAAGQPGASHAEEPVLWMRWDISRDVPPLKTADACRPFEMDHYEISSRWNELAMVLEGRETRTVYSIGVVENAQPLPENELIARLQELAGMEQALALEYLFARYSVRFGDRGGLAGVERDHAEFIAHEILAVAISEMMHLRWCNQLMWELSHLKANRPYEPALLVGDLVPAGKDVVLPGPSGKPLPKGMRLAEMKPLNLAIDNFLAAEAPSGTLEGKYAQIFSTLRAGYPPGLRELVSRIIADGVAHYSRFLEIRAVLLRYSDPVPGSGGPPREVSTRVKLIRELTPASPLNAGVVEIGDAYAILLRSLLTAFRQGDAEDRSTLADARNQMTKINDIATELANNGDGVPFLQLARKAHATLA